MTLQVACKYHSRHHMAVKAASDRCLLIQNLLSTCLRTCYLRASAKKRNNNLWPAYLANWTSDVCQTSDRHLLLGRPTFLTLRPSDVRRTSIERLTDAQHMSNERPTDIQQTSNGRPTDARRTFGVRRRKSTRSPSIDGSPTGVCRLSG